MIVCSGRLRGASAFGCCSSSVKSAPRLCSAKPVPGRHESAAEPLVDALNQRHDVARRDRSPTGRSCRRRAEVVRPSKTDGSTRAPRPPAAISRARALRCALSSIAADRHGAKPRIADVAQHVGVGQLLGFDHHVQRAARCEAVLAQRKLFHQVEHHQRGDALRVRRQLVDASSRDRSSRSDRPSRLELAQVGRGHRAAACSFEHREDGRRPSAPRRTRPRHRSRSVAERRGEIGVPEELAGPRRASVRQIGRGRVRARRPACRSSWPSAPR